MENEEKRLNMDLTDALKEINGKQAIFEEIMAVKESFRALMKNTN